MKNFSWIILVFFTFTVFSQSNQFFFKDCSAKQFKENLEKEKYYVLVDLRPAKQYKKSRIKNALYVESINKLLEVLEDKNKNIPVFLYSESGDESITAAAILMRKGYKKIYNLKEGIDSWYAEGYKLNKEKINNADLVKL
jgi:rhodanese-related sulfurtransferase